MTIIDTILGKFGYTDRKSYEQKVLETIKLEIGKKLPEWLSETADASKYTIPDTSIFATQADLYRLSPILGTAVGILGNDIGTSRLNIKRMVGEETRDIPNHPFELLLRNPNPADSGIEFIQSTASGYLLNGNAIWWLNREDQNDIPEEIWPIPFSMITPVPNGRMYISHYDYYAGNGKAPIQLPTWQIVHFKTYNPNNRFVGLSPLESLAMTIRGDLAMRETNTVTYAEYGGSPQSILLFKDFVPNDSWKDVKDEVRQAAKKNKMMMLRGAGDGVSWMQRAMSSKDMDFVAGLKQNMTDVFNRMCPGLLAMLDANATEANALAARATYSEKTLWPLMETIAQKITTDILPAYGRKLIAQFDDPRVVDKKLNLEEQRQYTLTHTVDEINKKYYQEQPKNDERGNLFISQITPENEQPEQDEGEGEGEGEDEKKPKTDIETDNQNLSVEDERDEDEMMKIELAKWKRYAVRTFGKKDKSFESPLISASIKKEINAKLKACKSASDVAAVFEAKIKHKAKKKKTSAQAEAILELAKSINKIAK